MGLMVFAVILLAACGPSSPVENLKEDLNRYPQYSIILEDMKQEGNIFKDYFHRYKIVYAEKVDNSDSLVFLDNITDWLEVKEKEYQKYQDYLGMAIASKTPDGEVTEAKYPPGYQYVGNPRYGQWRQDSHGNSFWEFYGKYAFISSMFSLFSRPVYMNDWDTYRDYRQTGRPYYGRNQRYG
ncbi:MAG: hypothetical protein GWN16_07410, partial [Calditrichae bacterium]|nr:hypothetical protein [Calditrichia bacterium]